jgi:hypothetical protein
MTRYKPVFDSQRYLRVGATVATISLLTRSVTMPPSWVFDDIAYSRRASESSWYRTGLTYEFGRSISAAVSVLRLFKGGTPNLAETAPLLLSELILARSVRGFAPYYQHLYVYIALLAQSKDFGNGRAPLVAYFPMLVYLNAGASKLAGSPRSWLVTGDILGNAIDLYTSHARRRMAQAIPARHLARLVLAFELFALPASLVDLRVFRLVCVAAVLFHSVNYYFLRVSFWHLASLHIPAILAIRCQLGGMRV